VRRLACLAIALVMLPTAVSAQTPAPPPDDAPAWEFAVAASAYFSRGDEDFVQPSITADRGRLHLEGRYNYEALDTTSVWAGYNFGGGETVTWELTPMFGAVFGATDGIAPGYKATIGWRKLEFYSEGEYVVDTGGSSNSFLYNWSELTLAPVEWFRLGLITQRTRLYGTDRAIDRGALAGVSFRRIDLIGYVFDRDNEVAVILTAVVNF